MVTVMKSLSHTLIFNLREKLQSNERFEPEVKQLTEHFQVCGSFCEVLSNEIVLSVSVWLQCLIPLLPRLVLFKLHSTIYYVESGSCHGNLTALFVSVSLMFLLYEIKS